MYFIIKSFSITLLRKYITIFRQRVNFIMNNFFENVPYNHPKFPIFIKKENILSTPFTSHINWHNDIEFVKILSGRISYCIDGEVIELSEGDGLYINANQVHYNFSSNNNDCCFLCVIFDPAFLCTKKHYEEKYILPVLTNQTLSHYILKKDTQWEKNILDYIEKIYDYKSDENFEPELYSAFFSIWASIYKNLGKKEKYAFANTEMTDAFKKMVSHIHLHYKEKITLEEIAYSGNVGKTTCNKIFNVYTGSSPVNYLTKHRLKKSIELMNTTNLTLTQIGFECGFSGASYFAEAFKKFFGYSPSSYKKLQFQSNSSDNP